jgi:hypothetical protein
MNTKLISDALKKVQPFVVEFADLEYFTFGKNTTLHLSPQPKVKQQ